MRTFWLQTLLTSCILFEMGCVRPVNTESATPWLFEARPENGQIQVLPVLSAFELSEVTDRDFVGPITPWRFHLRKQRIESIKTVPDAVAMALPGAIASELPADWNGRFLVGHYPGTLKSKMLDHLNRGESLDPILFKVGSRNEDVATLVSWVEELHATPITIEAAPGEMVTTEVGPIVVNLFEESYRIRATVGMALVASDGEVILRYRDDFESILGEQRNPNRVGRDLAIGLAKEITKMWPIDPRLREQAI